MTIDEIKQWQSDAVTDRESYVQKYFLKKLLIKYFFVFRYFIKEQKKSSVFQYDEPAELIEHEKRIQTSKNILNSKE